MPETPINGPSNAGNRPRTPETAYKPSAGSGATRSPPAGPEALERESGGSAESPETSSANGSARFGKGSGFVGKTGRSGPPKGNANNLRHGLKAGKLPADAKYIEIRLNIVRRNLEQTVIAAKGEISLPDAAAIQTCIRWERHAALAQRWLTKQYEELKPEQRINFSREIARASGERDKAIASLQLGEKVNRPWLIVADTAASELEDK